MKKNKNLTLEMKMQNVYDSLLTSSLLILQNTVYKEDISFKEEHDLPAEIYEVIEKLKKDSQNLHEILAPDSTKREELIEYYKSAKEAVIEVNDVIFLYGTDINLLSKIIEHHVMNEVYTKHAENGEVISYSTIANACIDHVSRCEDYKSANEIIADIMSSVKLRMTKNKYFDYVKEGMLVNIDEIPEGIATNCLDLYKYNLFPQVVDIYGKYIKAFSTPLKALWEMDFVNESTDRLKEILEILYDFNSDIEALDFKLFCIFEACNMMIMLLEYCNSLDDVFGDNLVIKDLYYAIKENSDLEKDDDMYIKIADLIEENMNLSIDELAAGNKDMFDTLHKTALEDISEIDKKILNDVNAMRELFYKNLLLTEMMETEDINVICNSNSYEELAKNNRKLRKMSRSEFADMIDVELGDILEGISYLPRETQKMVKQLGMKSIQSPYSVKEMLDYIEVSYEACSTDVEKNLFYHTIVGENNMQDNDDVDYDDDYDDDYSEDHIGWRKVESLEALEELEDQE